MKVTIISAAVLALSVASADAGNNNGPKGGNAIQGQAQGQIQGQLQGQAQSVHVETPKFTYGAHVGITSMNNSPCGRTTLGINSSGHNCTYRAESGHMQELLEAYYGGTKAEQKAAQAALTHWARNDKSVRETLIAIGLIK